MMHYFKKKVPQFFALLLSMSFLFLPTTGTAGDPLWDVEPEEENPSKYYDSILYSEIASKLREIEVNSNRVKVDVIGQSAGGRKLFLVTLSAPEALGCLGQYQAIRNTMLKDPEKAQEMIDKFGDFKVPVFINGSIHGDEYPGTDAAIRLIETLAYENSEEVQAILANVILLVNVVQNPDGRVLGTRHNINGFDINRDFITQSQPETRATVKILTEWNPMVTLDLHGFVTPMLIEPCTPPHNPNYEYDLYIKWAFDQALAMEAELFAQTGLAAQIPIRDDPSAWDDWSPIYTPMYAMYHGSYGHTLETPHEPWGQLTVDAHYAAVWGALKFVAENREGMINDQIEIFRRGFLDLPQVLIPLEILDELHFDQFNQLTLQEFPAAYVIPADDGFQVSPHQSARLVDFLLFNDVQVEKASNGFNLDGVYYPEGTYVVWMDQPKRGLANMILEDGQDLSDIEGLLFYSPPAAWSHPLLWGIERVVMEEKLSLQTIAVDKADAPQGSVTGGPGSAYAYLPTSIAAFQATNDLLARGLTLYRMAESFTDSGRSFPAGAVIVPDLPAQADELANHYALDVSALSGIPETAVLMKKQKIAVLGDEGVMHCLKTLGFDFDEVSPSELNAGAIARYDVFLNQDLRWSRLNNAGKASMSAWFAAGGDYVGLSCQGMGAQFAIDAGIAEVEYVSVSGNAIVKIGYNPDDTVSAGFLEDGFAFFYYPMWFTDYDGMDVSAHLDGGDFLVSGFWPGWQASGANGMPVIVHGEKGDEGIQDTVLIGIDPTFRGHPENTFRLVGNAIFAGLD